MIESRNLEKSKICDESADVYIWEMLAGGDCLKWEMSLDSQTEET